jgi:hypothetical protein
MRLPLPILGLAVAIDSHARTSSPSQSNVTYFGAPRYSIEGVLPVFDIGESYIRSQTGDNAKSVGLTTDGSCSRDRPCLLGSCCNSDGMHIPASVTLNLAHILIRSVWVWTSALLSFGPQIVRRRLRCDSTLRRIFGGWQDQLPVERVLLQPWLLRYFRCLLS